MNKETMCLLPWPLDIDHSADPWFRWTWLLILAQNKNFISYLPSLTEIVYTILLRTGVLVVSYDIYSSQERKVSTTYRVTIWCNFTSGEDYLGEWRFLDHAMQSWVPGFKYQQGLLYEWKVEFSHADLHSISK